MRKAGPAPLPRTIFLFRIREFIKCVLSEAVRDKKKGLLQSIQDHHHHFLRWCVIELPTNSIFMRNTASNEPSI